MVSISGIDYAGKSTQIQLLRDALSARGLHPRVLWYRPGYSEELDRLRRLVRRARPGVLPEPSSSSPRRAELMARPWVKASWISLALVDTLAQYALKVRALRAAGHTVICDRYIYDAIVDLQLWFPEYAKVFATLQSPWALACPRPDLSVLLMISWEEIQRRMQTKTEPFPDSEAMRRQRYAAYQRLAQSENFVVMDGERAAEDVGRDILAHLPERPELR